MKRLLIAAAALSAIAGAASAQPAWHAGAGGPPQDYPACSHPHQDRCAQHGGWRHHHDADDGDTGHHWRHHHHSSTDGERG